MSTQAPIVVIRIPGPVHEIHREMIARAATQAQNVEVEFRGPGSAERLLKSPIPVMIVRQASANSVDYRPTIRERIVSTLLDPTLAFLTLLAGMIFIYGEFCWPGTVLPGAFGGILVMLALYGLSASNLRPWAVALLVLSAVLFATSAFIPTQGLLSLAGAAALIAGAVGLINEAPEFRIRARVAIGASLPFALVTMLLTETAIRARTNKTSQNGAPGAAEQFQPVVFTSSGDILSTISDDSSQECGQKSARGTRLDDAG